MSPPRELRELRIALAGSRRLGCGLAAACDVEELSSQGWREQIADRRPHILLVEGGEGVGSAWAEELDGLLASCGQERVPRMLWVTGASVDPVLLNLWEHFDRAFAVGIEPLMRLIEAGFSVPSLLWLATALPVDDLPVADTSSRADSVVCVGGWGRDCTAEWRDRLIEILRAAIPHGLRILDFAEPRALPSDLRSHLDVAASGRRAEALRRAKLTIAAEGAAPVELVVPEIVFDAAACGAAVVSPGTLGSALDFWTAEPPHRLIPEVRSREEAAAAMDHLLGDDQFRERVVHDCRRVVAYNHTYAHRAATLASAAGYRLIPDAPARSAHS